MAYRARVLVAHDDQDWSGLYGKHHHREVGTAIWYRHRLIRTFLVQELGVEFERADSEACMMEHALSEDTMSRWLAYLEKQGISVEE